MTSAAAAAAAAMGLDIGGRARAPGTTCRTGQEALDKLLTKTEEQPLDTLVAEEFSQALKLSMLVSEKGGS